MCIAVGIGEAFCCEGVTIPSTGEEKRAFSLSAVLDGALVFLRGLSRVRCSSLGLSSTSKLGFGGGAGRFVVYMLLLAINICCKALKLDGPASLLPPSGTKEGGGLLGGGGGGESSIIRLHPTQFAQRSAGAVAPRITSQQLCLARQQASERLSRYCSLCCQTVAVRTFLPSRSGRPNTTNQMQ